MAEIINYPILLKEWDFSKNKTKNNLKTSKKYWWVCEKNKKHN